MRNNEFPYSYMPSRYSDWNTWRHSSFVRENYMQSYFLPQQPQHMIHPHATHNLQQYPSVSNFPSQVLPSSHQSNGWSNNLWNDFSLPPRPDQILIKEKDVSATNCQICWSLPRMAPQEYNKCKQRIEIYTKGSGKFVSASQTLPMSKTMISFKTTPGSIYEIKIEVLDARNHKIASGEFELKARTQMQPFAYLYRCKPKMYWDWTYHQGCGILEVYEKDLNGQPASPINEKMKGLFFSAKTLPNGALPTQSPFGEIRMSVPAISLLDPTKMNMYFSDFYCNSRGAVQAKSSTLPHYVTVVICLKGSESDRYCEQMLRQLSFIDNDFLRILPSNIPNNYNYFISKKVWVEIYYTENVPMKWGRFDNINATGAGTSKIGGLPNNKECLVCNLYPLGSSIGKSDANAIEQMLRDADEAPMVDSSDKVLTDSEFNNLLTYPEMLQQLDEMERNNTVEKDNESLLDTNTRILANKIRDCLTALDTDFSEIFDLIETVEENSSKVPNNLDIIQIQEIVDEL